MAVTLSSVAGIVSGRNPLEYSVSAPYTIFLFQAVFIILVCHLVHYPLSKIQQPRVIAEVVTGILLGPTVMGHVPKFTNTCFPKESIPGLTLFANIGVILLLFIIGLEVDVKFLKKNLKVALSVGLINMAIPFGMGFGIAKGLYNQYSSGDISFTTYAVFVAVALSITAFPVLVRILTELNLIVDRVGTIVLAAGIINDLTGWILLALTVTLANSASGVNTVYILLLTLAWFLFLLYPVRITMRFLLKKFTNDLVTGVPSQLSMMGIIICVFISAFYTDIIGVHPIFGAFMVGVIVPRDNGFVITITEKLEDLVHIVLIPLYFALAGLNVNLGLLNHGIDWAYIIGIILLAMAGKISGGFIAAKLNKLFWRESLAVGVLMSCKGIVEIVVLSIGLNVGIISQKVYSMFVVMALVTTFATTPLTLFIYPVSYREKVMKIRKGEITSDGKPIVNDNATEDDKFMDVDSESNPFNSYSIKTLNKFRINKAVILLKRINTVSNVMTLIHDIAIKNRDENNYNIDVKALHLREFTSRTSDLLEASSQSHDDTPSTENSTSISTDNDLNNSSSILAIMQIFSEFLGIHFSSKSLLTTIKNRILTINEQIPEKTDLLISSINTVQLIQDTHALHALSHDISSDNSEYTLHKELFESCKSHFGLLLVNDNKKKVGQLDGIIENEENVFEAHQNSKFGLKSINLVLNHSDLISNSDLLALHLVYKLSFNVSQVNIFIRSTASSSPGDSDGFESQIESLLLKNNPSIAFSINRIKDSYNFVDELKRLKGSLIGETFIVANNVSKSDSKLFEDPVADLVGLGVSEGFNILAVKASH